MAATGISLADKNVLVMGLGRFGGGVGVARWLVSQGARVTVTDMSPAEQLTDSIAALDGLPITFKLGGHDLEDFRAADLVIINPAVDKRTSPHVQAALEKGVATTTEMNLFLERCPARTIGITGSVGKSTTTALIHEALKAGLEIKNQKSKIKNQKSPQVFLGGNIGRSLLLDLPHIQPHDLVVLELSSFMLDETPAIEWSPQIAVITNIFPNHLDRHQTMAAYTAAKQNILRFQKPGDLAILNNDHELVPRWAGLARGKVVKYTTRGPADKIPPLLIPGEHNRSNAAAAIAVIDNLGTPPAPPTIDRPAALHAIETFTGLAHRLQLVHTLHVPSPAGASRKIRFYNDSKATTPDASMTALTAFPPRTAIFLVGGYDKHIDMSPFTRLLAQRAGAVVGLGATGQALIDATLANEGAPMAFNAGTLEAALRQAHAWAVEHRELEAVVLSPASASWDQFPNYEKRGEIFVDLTGKLSPS